MLDQVHQCKPASTYAEPGFLWVLLYLVCASLWDSNYNNPTWVFLSHAWGLHMFVHHHDGSCVSWLCLIFIALARSLGLPLALFSKVHWPLPWMFLLLLKPLGTGSFTCFIPTVPRELLPKPRQNDDGIFPYYFLSWFASSLSKSLPCSFVFCWK